MNAQQQLKVFELDLTSYDLKIGTDSLFKHDIVKMLRPEGVSRVDKPGNERPGSLQVYIKKHMEGSKNFILINGYPVLESQSKGGDKSILFNYYQSPKSNRTVYLDVSQVRPAEHYPDAKKISVEEFRQMVDYSKIEYKPLNKRFMLLDEVRKFGTASTTDKEIRLIKNLFNEASGGNNTLDPEWVPLKVKVPERKPFPFEGKIPRPEFDVLVFKEYELSLIEHHFDIASFERRTSDSHLRSILKSMIDGSFYSVVATVARPDDWDYQRLERFFSGKPKPGEPKTKFIDFQHRIEDYIVLRDMYNQTTFPLVVFAVPERYARKVYISSNRGKPLKKEELTRGMDNGKIVFFKVNRDEMNHYPKNNRLSFMQALKMHAYAETKNSSVHGEVARSYAEKLDAEQSIRMKLFMQTMRNTVGASINKIPENRPIVRNNIYRHFFERGMDTEDLKKFVIKLANDNRITELSRGLSKQDYRKVYLYMKEHLPKDKV